MNDIDTTRATIEAAVVASFATIDRANLRWAKSCPTVKLTSRFGWPTIEVSMHWEVQASTVEALSGLGLPYKLTNHGVAIFYLS